MSTRVKKRTVVNKDLKSAFNRIMDDIPQEVMLIKYTKYKNALKHYIVLLKLCPVQTELLTANIAELENIYDMCFKSDTLIYNKENFLLIDKGLIVKHAICTCSKLVTYQKYIETEDDSFLTDSSMLTFTALCDVDFCQAHNNGIKVIEFLHVLLDCTNQITDIYSIPNIDIEKFVDIVERSIKEMKKRLPRCENAFRIILRSLHSFRDNFQTYYNSYLCTGDSSRLIEDHFMKVANEKDIKFSNPSLYREFTEILDLCQETSIKNKVRTSELNNLFASAYANCRKGAEDANNT